MKDLCDIDLKQLIEDETGERFKKGYINCPFHGEKTPSLSVKYYPDKNKEKFKCFGCEISGDAIDFIMKLKNLDYRSARTYLGLETEKTEAELLKEKVLGYIDWELSKFREGQKLAGIFEYTNEKNEILYFKAKFKCKDGKQLSYYHIENNKVVANRGGVEVPYNYYKVVEGMKYNKKIIIVEGEKDANNINSLLRNDNYVATSIKGCKEEEILQMINSVSFHKPSIYIIADTGEAGEKYKWYAYKIVNQYCSEFKFINLPGLKNLGDNKDVTDWIEAGHNKKDLLMAFKRSLDIKNKFELQQDSLGIYKTIFKEKSDEVIEIKKYLTDFNILEAMRIKFIDDDVEGVKLILKSTTGEIIERTGLSTVFDDTKTFKNFLGTLDLGFKGKVDDLTDLKSWINKYFALENQEIHGGVKFIERNNKITFIENNGSIDKDSIDINIKSDGRNNADVLEIEKITKEELQELKKYILRFIGPEKSISIIGTIINNLAVFQAKQLKIKFHHLLIVGESGSGKSTILENIIASILNYPKKDIRSIGLITSFALMKSLSDGNYPIIFDEFKPSSLDRYKILNLSETLRNLYDRSTISKGNKSLKIRDFNLERPIILAGEESYPNQEKALIERSCIVYLAKRERTDKNTEAMKWLIKHENILRKFGRSLIEIVLNISIEEYEEIRERADTLIKDLENRPRNTAVNIISGIFIFNKLLAKHGLKELVDFSEFIENNIKNEVLEGVGDTRSIAERMIILYNEMIEDGRAYNFDDVVKSRGDGIFIKTSEMVNQIHEHINRVGADLIPLKLRDFRKQAQKAGYITGVSDKVIKNSDGKPVRYDSYNRERLGELNINSIVPPDFVEVSGKRVDKIFDLTAVTKK